MARRTNPRGLVVGGEVLGPDEAKPPAQEFASPASIGDSARVLAVRLATAGTTPPLRRELDGSDLCALDELGQVDLVGPFAMDRQAWLAVEALVRKHITEAGAITVAELRDLTLTSRRYAQAFLDHLDGRRITKRLPDDRRILRL